MNALFDTMWLITYVVFLSLNNLVGWLPVAELGIGIEIFLFLKNVFVIFSNIVLYITKNIYHIGILDLISFFKKISLGELISNILNYYFNIFFSWLGKLFERCLLNMAEVVMTIYYCTDFGSLFWKKEKILSAWRSYEYFLACHDTTTPSESGWRYWYLLTLFIIFYLILILRVAIISFTLFWTINYGSCHMLIRWLFLAHGASLSTILPALILPFLIPAALFPDIIVSVNQSVTMENVQNSDIFHVVEVVEPPSGSGGNITFSEALTKDPDYQKGIENLELKKKETAQNETLRKKSLGVESVTIIMFGFYITCLLILALNKGGTLPPNFGDTVSSTLEEIDF